MSSTEGQPPSTSGRSPDEVAQLVRFLEAEVTDLRRRLADMPGNSRAQELRLADTQRSLSAVTAQNERLAQTLREARDQITKLKEEVDRLAQPPAGFGTFLARHEDDARRCPSTRPGRRLTQTPPTVTGPATVPSRPG